MGIDEATPTPVDKPTRDADFDGYGRSWEEMARRLERQNRLLFALVVGLGALNAFSLWHRSPRPAAPPHPVMEGMAFSSLGEGSAIAPAAAGVRTDRARRGSVSVSGGARVFVQGDAEDAPPAPRRGSWGGPTVPSPSPTSP